VLNTRRMENVHFSQGSWLARGNDFSVRDMSCAVINVRSTEITLRIAYSVTLSYSVTLATSTAHIIGSEGPRLSPLGDARTSSANFQLATAIIVGSTV